MTTTPRLALAAVALAASVSIASAQTAQDHQAHHPTDQTTQQQPPRQMGRAPQTAMMGGDMGRMMAMMQTMRDGMVMPMGMGTNPAQPFAHLDGRLAYWRAELHLTDAQASQWDVFAKAVRENAGKLQPVMMSAMQTNGELAAPDQLDHRIAFLAAELDAIRAVQAAVKPLYDALTPEQKKIADGLMADHMLGMGARGL